MSDPSNAALQVPAKAPANDLLTKIRLYGTVAVSMFAMATFAFALLWSFLTNDEGMKNLTGGAAVAMATTAINWWMGSSKGSEKKDDIIANSPPVVPPTS